jgi:hypothetical protein
MTPASPMSRAFSPDGVPGEDADPHWAVKVSSGRLSEIRPYNKSADAFLY